MVRSADRPRLASAASYSPAQVRLLCHGIVPGTLYIESERERERERHTHTRTCFRMSKFIKRDVWGVRRREGEARRHRVGEREREREPAYTVIVYRIHSRHVHGGRSDARRTPTPLQLSPRFGGWLRCSFDPMVRVMRGFPPRNRGIGRKNKERREKKKRSRLTLCRASRISTCTFVHARQRMHDGSSSPRRA
jgi:hypothetical protein